MKETTEQVLSDAEIAEKKIVELNDKYLRLNADFDNFRKRTIKEKTELLDMGSERIFKCILPILDDFERSLIHYMPDDGVTLIYNKLKSTMISNGLTVMNSVGEIFNSDLHEAITNVNTQDDSQRGKVIEELEKGYSLNGKIIRFAKVIVGN